MTGRDRLVAVGFASLAVLAAVWVLLVSPERQRAAKLQTEVNAASAQLLSAEGQVAGARSAQASYAAAYATVVRLGKAVPAGQEVPSLIYELAQASNQKKVDFSSIATSSSGSPTSSATSAAAAAGLNAVPFTFTFTGSFSSLSHLFQQLNGFAMRTASGALQVNGRLLTVQSLKLAPVSGGSEPAAGAKAGQLTGTITATAYVLPAAQGLTGGATGAAPSAVSSGSTASAVSSPRGSGSSASAPAIVRGNP
jgi:Tfp pilus assembly protein PilO